MANKVLGMHRLKNKVNRNAFDLSHRHMFTAQVGELLPVFSQWVNPNETFKIGYNGKTRTAALNTDAFMYRDWETDRKSTRLNSSHRSLSRMPSSA